MKPGRSVLLSCLILAIVAAACGNDEVSAETTAFCDAARDVDAVMNELDPTSTASVDGAKAAMNAALAIAPEDVEPSWSTMVDLATGVLDTNGDLFAMFLQNEDFTNASATVDGWMVENCGYEAYDVAAVDYAYSGMPAAVKAGDTALTFRNQGSEVHEMVLVGVNDGVTESLDELLALPEEESESKTKFMGVAFALPGTGDTVFYDLEPGRYAYFCFLPQGATPDKLEALFSGSFDGPPHFTLGMKGEFTVEG